jgi:hypothetical protein
MVAAGDDAGEPVSEADFLALVDAGLLSREATDALRRFLAGGRQVANSMHRAITQHEERRNHGRPLTDGRRLRHRRGTETKF